jgi:hypothetical protein
LQKCSLVQELKKVVGFEYIKSNAGIKVFLCVNVGWDLHAVTMHLALLHSFLVSQPWPVSDVSGQIAGKRLLVYMLGLRYVSSHRPFMLAKFSFNYWSTVAAAAIVCNACME